MGTLPPPPADTILGPLQEQLCLVAAQVGGIDPTLCLASPPRGPLQDGMVLFPVKGWRVESLTNGRIRLRITFEALHFFRIRGLDEVIPDIQAYVPGWWQALGAWKNQTLGGLAISFDFTGGDIVQVKHNNTDYLALSHTLEVLVQITIATASA